MRVILFLLASIAALVACTHESPCTPGGSCSSRGATCSPAPVGSGWSHALQCTGGKWTEIEIAPLPTAQSDR